MSIKGWFQVLSNAVVEAHCNQQIYCLSILFLIKHCEYTIPLVALSRTRKYGRKDGQGTLCSPVEEHTKLHFQNIFQLTLSSASLYDVFTELRVYNIYINTTYFWYSYLSQKEVCQKNISDCLFFEINYWSFLSALLYKSS